MFHCKFRPCCVTGRGLPVPRGGEPAVKGSIQRVMSSIYGLRLESAILNERTAI